MAQKNSHLTKEYQGLWEDHGLDAVVLKRKKKQKKTKGVPKAPAGTKSLAEIQTWLGDCRRCGLCNERDKIVFGSGNPKAKILFIGEGPGKAEDKSGVPFVGRAGVLLDKIIEAMSLTRDEVYIANIVKCRPPKNRVPTEKEIDRCLPFLQSQIKVIQPKMIVTLGLTASSILIGDDSPMGQLRGKFHKVVWSPSIPLMATYHPAYLLRNPAAKKVVWEDMKQVLKKMKESH